MSDDKGLNDVSPGADRSGSGSFPARFFRKTKNAGGSLMRPTNNIQFETNSFTLINSSFSDIDELISNLKKYENLEIEIQGHTDNVGNYDYNLRLSELRAKSVYNYIVERDSLLVDRITFKGYGEDKPIDDNTTDRGRAINRRTSFLIKNF